MVNRRSVTALSTAVALAWSVALVAQKKDDKKQSDAQKKEIQDIVRIVDGVTAGQPAPNDLGLAWVHEDFLKATGNKEYIPFTVTYDPVQGHRAETCRCTGAWSPGTRPARQRRRPCRPRKDEKKDDKKAAAAPRFAYEDLNTVPVTPAQTGPAKISRAFTVGGGAYDVYVVLKEADLAAEERPGAEGVADQADGDGAGFLDAGSHAPAR